MDQERKFTETYELYSDAIFRFVFLKVRNREMAIDITQDAFMKTWMYLASGNDVTHMRAFLYRTAYTTMLNALRRKQAVSLEELRESGWEPADESPGPEHDAARSEEERELYMRLHRLTDEHRDILILRYIDELSVPEIAHIIGETENNVSVRIHRAKKHLQEKYL